MEKNGKVLWEYKGPRFVIGAHKPENLIEGTLYDLLGFPVWMRDFDDHLLKGRVLTASMVGSPEPQEHLVIENAPEDYLKKFSQKNAGTVLAASLRAGLKTERGSTAALS